MNKQNGQVRNKKLKRKKALLLFNLLFILFGIFTIFILAFISCDRDSKKDGAYKLKHGELINATKNEIDGLNVLIIKAKISSSYSNSATIHQNYFNVEDLIQNQGCNTFDEIQYWAVADMTDGSESKVISFTVDADLIKLIANEKVVATQFGDYVSELWILPSLLSE